MTERTIEKGVMGVGDDSWGWGGRERERTQKPK